MWLYLFEVLINVIIIMINDIYPGSSIHAKVISIRLNWNLEMLVFEDRGKLENPEKKPLGAD